MSDHRNSGVGEFLYTLYLNQQFTDVTFIPKDGKISISAHRLVLAAKCPYFEELLFGKKKKEALKMEKKFTISNMEFKVFCNILEYFYTGDIEFRDDSTVLEIYAGAKQFQIQPLIERCEAYIESLVITEENVCSTFQLSDTKNIESLKDRCIEYIQENTEKVISSTAFEKCTYTTVHMICNLQSLNLSNETNLLDAVARWRNVQPSHTKLQITEPLLSCIQLLTLTAKEFGESIRKYPDLIAHEDALKIMMFLNGTEEYENLPSWCSKNTDSRCVGQLNRGKYEYGPHDQENTIQRITVLLQPAFESQEITELTSSMQMECLQGSHQIKGLKFSIESAQCIVIASLKLQVFPSAYTYNGRIFIRSKRKIHKLPKEVYVWQGDVIYIEVKISDIQNCKFLQLDKKTKLRNNDFKWSVQTEKGLFCISGVEYGSQIIPENFNRKRQRPKKVKALHHASTKSVA